MTANRFLAYLVVTLVCIASASAVTIDMVTIGNLGNAPDTRYDATGFGSVDYKYRIGTTEVTNAQFVAFLNSVDPTGANTLALYSSFMTSRTWGGVTFTGGASVGSKYSIKAPALSGAYTYADKPVVFVSWFDAIRFANWLHNGQGGPGTTESGAYTLLGGTPIPSNADTITRNPGARSWLPNEDEWYKAAYYDPAAGIYYDYPTGTNSVPNNNLPTNDTGNSANFRDDMNNYTTRNFDYPMTDAGAYTLSASPYGTFDQSGNAWEWDETLVHYIVSSSRGVRGGAWNFNSDTLPAGYRVGDVPSVENPNLGFRVASLAVPEPSTLLLGASGLLTVLLRRRRLTMP